MATNAKTQLFDVVAVTIEAPNTVRLLDEGKDDENAGAVVNLAVMRRGVETEFYSIVPAGMYRDGDAWRGNGRDTDE